MQVLHASPWVPTEWIAAHGLQPRGVWSMPELTGGPMAIAEGICPMARAVVHLAETNPGVAMVFATSCDQMRRGFDSVAAMGNARLFLFNVPATWQTPAARRLYHAEVLRLGKFLERLGGKHPTPARLHEVIRRFNSRRAGLRSLIGRSTARQAAEAMCRFCSDGTVAEACQEGKQQPPRPPSKPLAYAADNAKGVAASKSNQVPLALVGGPLLPSEWVLFEAVEAAGGRIVLNATEPGERCLLPPLPDCTGFQDPLTALADHYFDHCIDAFRRPNTRLYGWLAPRLRSRKVRGIVLWHYTGCDLWRAEAASMRATFDLPVLALESHDTDAGRLRNANRLAAFLELFTTGGQVRGTGGAEVCKRPRTPEGLNSDS